MRAAIELKRAYEPPSDHDGTRVLVDRLWPRGVSKKNADVDYWLKQVAPSSELRRWFNHEPIKFQQFKEKYKQELYEDQVKQAQLEKLKDLTKQSAQITLVYGARDKQNNHALVLKEHVEELLRSE